VGVEIVTQLEHDQLPSLPLAEVAGIARTTSPVSSMVAVMPGAFSVSA
jgi:hypothetical protein